MTFAEEVRAKRLELGLTQAQMAKKLKMSLSTYKNIEIYNGAYGGTYPSATTIGKLRRFGIIDMTYLEVIATIKRDRKVEQRHAQYGKGRKKYERQGSKDYD